MNLDVSDHFDVRFSLIMGSQLNKEAVLRENKSLIDMTVMSACNGQSTAELENYLMLAAMDGWQQLVAAVRLVITGERNMEIFEHLDEEDSIVIKNILEQLENPDVSVRNLLLSARNIMTQSADHACTLIEKAMELQPENPAVYAMQGHVFHSQKRLKKAVASYQQSLHLLPQQPQLLLNLGIILNDLKKVDEAMDAFKQVLKYQPDNLDAMAHLAYLYEFSGKLEKADEIINRGLTIDTEHAILLFMQGKLSQRAGNAEQAIKLFKRSLDLELSNLFSGDAYSRLGYLYDQSGETDSSIECFTLANRIYRETCSRTGIDKQAFINDIEQVQSLKIRADYGRDAAIDNYKDPVFLIGFPRSGTTLLNQILDSHKNIKTTEEKPAASNMIRELFEIRKQQPGEVLELSGSNMMQLRKIYFDEVLRHIELSSDSIYIDKFPLNIAFAPLLRIVFPNARFILALRHPCDACLSCFMHSFSYNAAMANFTTIDDTVSLYVRLMSSWEQYCKTGNVEFHRIRYEDLIENFQPEVEKLLEFLGLEWDDAVYAHTENARKKGIIDTPSYDQVTEPLYKRAMYRWKKYEPLFTHHMKNLAPLIECYAYKM